MKASRERMEALMCVSLQTMEACREKIKVNQGKVETKMEACLKWMKVVTIGALEDRYGDRRLGRPKKRTRGDGGSQ
jgi:hypothetical protein